MLNARGVITWDIEMESIVTDPNSPHTSMKLDDASFKTMRDAAFCIGVCIRPQHFTLNADGTALETEMLGKNAVRR